MNKNILKQLQFGFEIEGHFDTKLEELPGEFKEDGSVGSDQRIQIPGNFTAINLEDFEENESCESCDGSGERYVDCECDYDQNECSHEHTTECERRSPEGHLLSYHNCTHQCSENDSCFIRPCDGDDEYHREECNDCNGSGRNGQSGYAAEYASGIFTNFDNLIKELKEFKSGKTKPNHIWNKTCGLHLHIGNKPHCKPGYKRLWNATANMEFLVALHSQAATWCDCQRKRLVVNDDHYYQFWKTGFDLICTYNNKYPLRDFSHNQPSEKFRFLRFHKELKTLEFRFLSPCQHKVENVEKLLSFLTDYLGGSNEYNSQAEVIDKPVNETVKINLTDIQPIKTNLLTQTGRIRTKYVLHHDF